MAETNLIIFTIFITGLVISYICKRKPSSNKHEKKAEEYFMKNRARTSELKRD